MPTLPIVDKDGDKGHWEGGGTFKFGEGARLNVSQNGGGVRGGGRFGL